jgi:hypothetical protein
MSVETENVALTSDSRNRILLFSFGASSWSLPPSDILDVADDDVAERHVLQVTGAALMQQTSVRLSCPRLLDSITK